MGGEMKKGDKARDKLLKVPLVDGAEIYLNGEKLKKVKPKNARAHKPPKPLSDHEQIVIGMTKLIPRGIPSRYLKKPERKEPSGKVNVYDEMAKEVFKEFGIDLFEFLKPWLEKFGVEKIVLGGNISLAADLFVPSIKTELAKEGLSSISIDISELGETAAIIGGARLIEPDYWLKIKEVIKDM